MMWLLPWLEVVGVGILIWWAGMLPAMYISARFFTPKNADSTEWWLALFWPIGLFLFLLIAPGAWLWDKGLEQGAFAESRKKKELDR